MTRGNVQDLTIYSSELEEELQLLVYLPPQYTPIYEYEYCIAQDGKDYFQMGRIPRTLDELIENGEIKPVLFFGVPYKNVRDRRSKYHPEGEKQQKYIRFLVHELVPFIEKEFPVGKDSSFRALAGDSLAATVSFMASLSHPSSFDKLILHSPYVDENVKGLVRNFKNWGKMHIYHVVGKEETNVDMTDGTTADFLTANRGLYQLLKDKNMNYFYDEFDGDHTWTYWQNDLKRALARIFEL